MINEISAILMLFRGCFSRAISFKWFVVVIMELIVRLDHNGVSSMIRWLSLGSSYHHSLLAFFKASSWKLSALQIKWQKIVRSQCPPILIDGRQIVIGDGIKISKEANKMPGVKKLHQESDNSGKAPYISIITKNRWSRLRKQLRRLCSDLIVYTVLKSGKSCSF